MEEEISGGVCDTKHDSEHVHVDEHGKLHKCYHSCKSVICSWGFWIGTTFSFPIEHFIWEKLPIFSTITKWMGL